MKKQIKKQNWFSPFLHRISRQGWSIMYSKTMSYIYLLSLPSFLPPSQKIYRIFPQAHARPTQPSSHPIHTPLLPPFRPRHVSKWLSSLFWDSQLRPRTHSFAAFAAILPPPNTASLALRFTLRPKRHLHPTTRFPHAEHLSEGGTGGGTRCLHLMHAINA